MPILQWLDREKHVRAAEAISYRLLEADDALSAGDADTPNMLIQGDNLEALKALLPYYAGRVRCICIDPPYNTRSAFEHYDDNLEHSQWLAMMYPRLALLREKLAEDGSIWVTIDDNEAHYLKVILDEVFGRSKFVANIVWQKKYARQNDAQQFSTSHDHILVYGKSNLWRPNKLPRNQKQIKGYSNPDNDRRGLWQSVVYTCAKSRQERPNLYYPIVHPKTGKEVWPSETRVWAYDHARHLEHVAENRLWWGANQEKDKPRLKSFLEDVGNGVVPDTLWLRDDSGDNQDAKREIHTLFGSDAFGTPKPEKLMQKILTIATKKDDLVVDSFLGSGTTAAVAHKMARRYIGIEMGDHAVTHCAPRLREVIEGEQGGISGTADWKGGGGFRFYRLGAPVFDAEGRINSGIRFSHLAAHVWFSETHTALHKKPRGPLLGRHNGAAYYLLYNGVLGDKRPDGGNVLTNRVLSELPAHAGLKVIYGEACRIGPARLKDLGIVFKQTPYDVKAR